MQMNAYLFLVSIENCNTFACSFRFEIYKETRSRIIVNIFDILFGEWKKTMNKYRERHAGNIFTWKDHG